MPQIQNAKTDPVEKIDKGYEIRLTEEEIQRANE